MYWQMAHRGKHNDLLSGCRAVRHVYFASWVCYARLAHPACVIYCTSLSYNYNHPAVWHLYWYLASPSHLPDRSPPPDLSLQWGAEMLTPETQGAAATGVGMQGTPLESMTTGVVGHYHLQEGDPHPCEIPGTTGKEGHCPPHAAGGKVPACCALPAVFQPFLFVPCSGHVHVAKSNLLHGICFTDLAFAVVQWCLDFA